MGQFLVIVFDKITPKDAHESKKDRQYSRTNEAIYREKNDMSKWQYTQPSRYANRPCG